MSHESPNYTDLIADRDRLAAEVERLTKDSNEVHEGNVALAREVARLGALVVKAADLLYNSRPDGESDERKWEDDLVDWDNARHDDRISFCFPENGTLKDEVASLKALLSEVMQEYDEDEQGRISVDLRNRIAVACGEKP